MNRADVRRLDAIRTQADRLLDGPKVLDPVVRNIDVLEAVLGDVQRVARGSDPVEVSRLIKQAEEAGEL